MVLPRLPAWMFVVLSAIHLAHHSMSLVRIHFRYDHMQQILVDNMAHSWHYICIIQSSLSIQSSDDASGYDDSTAGLVGLQIIVASLMVGLLR